MKRMCCGGSSSSSRGICGVCRRRRGAVLIPGRSAWRGMLLLLLLLEIALVLLLLTEHSGDRSCIKGRSRTEGFCMMPRRKTRRRTIEVRRCRALVRGT